MNRGQRFGRLLLIVSEVVVRPGRTPAQLAAVAGVSERTLSRDLRELRRLGVDVTFSEGYRLQERLGLGGAGLPDGSGRGGSLASVYEQQLRLVRVALPGPLAASVQAEVEACAPRLLADLVGAAIVRASPRPRTGRSPAQSPQPGSK